MLRSLLVGLLVAGVASCKHEGGAVEVVPGAPAGKVVEVVGAVTASRGGATRPLAVGDTVAADDEVATPADGRVAIELAHNGARWELGAGKRKRVADSLAWNQARAEGPSRGELATTAAGRPAEKAAAEGAASAKADHETAPAEEDGKRPRTAIGSPTPEPTAASVDQVPAPPEPTTTRVTKTPATPPPKPKPDRQEAKTEAKPPTLQPAPLGGVPGHRGADKAVDGPLDSSGGGPTETIAKDDAPGASRRTIAQAAAPGAGQRTLAAHAAELRACLADTATVHLVLELDAAGKLGAVTIGDAALPAAVHACLERQLRAIRFPAGAGHLTFDVTR